MLTKDIISGFNVLSLAGFVAMALALSRSGQTGRTEYRAHVRGDSFGLLRAVCGRPVNGSLTRH
jgi:hypothetical protein